MKKIILQKKTQKEIIIIFGSREEIIIRDFKLFIQLEKRFKCNIIKTAPFTYIAKIKEIKVIFFFAYGSEKEWNKHKKHYSKKGINIPPSIEIICKNIKKNYTPNIVLFFGFCGALKGKLNDVFLPTSIRKLLFRSKIINPEKIGKLIPDKKIKINNILLGKINGKAVQTISTNKLLQHLGAVDPEEWLFLWRKYISKKNPNKKFDFKVAQKWTIENAIKYYKILDKYGEALDMEAYTIAKYFQKKKIGIMLQSIDVLSRGIILNENFKVNDKKFNKNVINAIKNVIKNI